MAKKRPKVKLGEAPPYPTDVEAKGYARSHKLWGIGETPCNLSYSKYQHNQTVDVLCTWGCNNIFFVFAYPPAGFVIAKPEDVLKLQAFEGWILEYQAQDDIFNLLVKASRDGVDYFWKRHRELTR